MRIVPYPQRPCSATSPSGPGRLACPILAIGWSASISVDRGAHVPDPYKTLGLPPEATRAQAESAFRRLLMESHPDRHVGEGPDALAEAEQRTRELTAAIAAVRKGWTPAAAADPRNSTAHRPRQHRASGPPPWERTYGFEASDDTDWFGNPSAREERVRAVSCPWCGEPFWHIYDFEQHLVLQHESAERLTNLSRRRSRSRLITWLRYLPMPSGTLLLLLIFWWYAVVLVLPTSVEPVGIWIGVLGFMFLRALVFHHQRR